MGKALVPEQNGNTLNYKHELHTSKRQVQRQADCLDRLSHRECSLTSLGFDCGFCEVDLWVSLPNMTWDYWLVV